MRPQTAVLQVMTLKALSVGHGHGPEHNPLLGSV